MSTEEFWIFIEVIVRFQDVRARPDRRLLILNKYYFFEIEKTSKMFVLDPTGVY